MNIRHALDMAFATDRLISRPHLMDERNSYLLYQDEHAPILLCRFDSPLRTAWTPSPTELMADDWFFVEG